MDTHDIKPWYTSKTIIGALITLVSSFVAATTDFTVSEALKNCAVDTVTDLVPSVMTGLSGIGALLSIWGRATATKKIR
jgi:hypothetical protein